MLQRLQASRGLRSPHPLLHRLSQRVILEGDERGKMHRTLDLTKLSSISSVSERVLGAHAEAASVMLERFHAPPPPPTGGTWHDSGKDDVSVSVFWEEPTLDAKRSHANDKDATEEGAYAVAVAIAHEAGFRVVARTFHGSGCDWVMVPHGEPENDYYKLEVSGVEEGGSPGARLTSKVKQGRAGELERPGMAVVVRFEDVRILTEKWR